MKILRFIVFVFVFFVFNGCMPMDDESVTLSFWTDNELSESEFRILFVNEKLIGDFDRELKSPSCNVDGLLNYESLESEDLILTIRNLEGESIEIGVVNLFSVSSGIKIKPSDHGRIFVDQTLDDDCTLIRLNWDE